MSRSAIPLILLGFSLFFSSSLFASDKQTFKSKKQTYLLELYTSEGCSSCPPADRWLSQLEDDKRLWKEIIPISFHVDYWNMLGWPDRFSSAENSLRQRWYKQHGFTNSVYTPGFYLQGEEWRGFFQRRNVPRISNNKPGELTLKREDQRFSIEFKADQHSAPLQINVALLGSNLETDVKAGENRSKRLHHDFVALALNNITLEYRDGAYHAEGELPTSHIDAPREALIAWVTKANHQQPIQAVGGWIN